MTVQYALAALASFTLISTPAFSQPVRADGDTWRTAVSYADLNLNTPSGQAVLKARIQRAALAVCGPEPDSRDLAPQMAFRRCMKQSMDSAVAAIPSASHLAGSTKPAG
jgi:UrcA family protein